MDPPDRGTAPASAVSRRATLWAMGALTALNLLNYIDRFVLPPVIREVARDIPMSDARQGLVLSAFIWVYMVTSPLFGWLGDRARRKVLIAVGVAIWSLATGAGALAHSFAALMAARAAVGIGEAAYATVAPSLIGDYFPQARRGRVLATFFLAIPVGSALGYALGGTLGARYGWRAAFLAVGLPGLVLALVALTIREPPRGQFDAGGAGRRLSLREALADLGRSRLYRWTVAGGTLYTFALGGIAQWMPAFLQRERHMTVAHSSSIFGIITVVAGFAGTAAGGVLAERLRGRVREPYLWVSGVSVLLAVPLAVLSVRLTSETPLWVSLFAVEFLLFMCTGPFNTVLVNCVAANNRAMAFAVSIFVTHALGDALSPALIGVISDATSLATAVLVVPAAFAAAAVCWLYAERTLAASVAPTTS